MNSRRLRIVLPVIILLFGVGATTIMIKSRGPVATRPSVEYAPLVRVVTVQPTGHRFTVTTHGTVKPRTETALVAEVAGRVVDVAPSFAQGGFFEKGDVLVRVDPRDYELAVVTAKGQVAQARVRAELEEAQAEVAREEWKTLGDGRESPLATRELQLQEAQAALAAAEAALERAERDLARTRIRAPFAGRVREKRVDVGQFVSPGVPIAQVFAVDYVEVRLPIPDAELAYLELPVNYRGDTESKKGPDVLIHADFAGRRHTWSGRIVRTEGEIDPVSRMVHAVAQVDDPYGRGDSEDNPMPLAVGLFVEAEILGRHVEDVILVPPSAVRRDSTVFVVDSDDRLQIRPIELLRVGRTTAVIAGGLNTGERVCISPLETVTAGTKVRTTTVGSGSEESAEVSDRS